MNKSTNFRFTQHFLLFSAVVAGVLLPTSAKASLALGTFTTSGTVDISFSSIFFVPGTFTIVPGATGDFTAAGFTGGTIKNIANPPYSVGTPVLTNDFMTFSNFSNLSFELDILQAGPFEAAGCTAAPTAGGQTCGPSNSPYSLVNLTSTLSVASFTVTGFERDTVTGQAAKFQGIFAATFPESLQEVAATVNGGATIQTSYSGSFVVTPVPEPRFMVLLVSVFLGSAGFKICRRSRVQ